MTLDHNGASLQGKIVGTQPDAGIVNLTIAGNSDGRRIKVDEVVTYTPDSRNKNFEVHKSGMVENENAFTLHTEEGPFPGTQRWTRVR